MWTSVWEWDTHKMEIECPENDDKPVKSFVFSIYFQTHPYDDCHFYDFYRQQRMGRT